MIDVSSMTTPALLLDARKLRRNVDLATQRAKSLGVQLRPHMKTSKSVDVARLMLGETWTSMAVSTVPEVVALYSAGVRNIRYTSPFDHRKLADLKPMIQSGLEFETLIDDPSRVAALSAAAVAHSCSIHLLIELDVDGYRAGAATGTTDLIAFAKEIMERPGLSFSGIYSFAGKTYRLPRRADRAELIERHRAALVRLAEDLRLAGINPPTIGIGGSPVLESAAILKGLTEVCEGVYCFQDLTQAGIGVTNIDDLAVSVLSTVTQHQPATGRIFVDAGSLALSLDRSTGTQELDQGYGLVCDAASGLPLGDGDIIVARTSQEHGLVQRRDGKAAPADLLPVGERVRILPNHVCMTAAGHSTYKTFNSAPDEAREWRRVSGWQVEKYDADISNWIGG